MEVEANTFTRLLHSRTNRYRVAMLAQRSNPFNEFFNGQRDNKTLLLFPIRVSPTMVPLCYKEEQLMGKAADVAQYDCDRAHLRRCPPALHSEQTAAAAAAAAAAQ